MKRVATMALLLTGMLFMLPVQSQAIVRQPVFDPLQEPYQSEPCHLAEETFTSIFPETSEYVVFVVEIDGEVYGVICLNDPVNNIDPDGRSVLSWMFGFGYSGNEAEEFDVALGEQLIAIGGGIKQGVIDIGTGEWYPRAVENTSIYMLRTSSGELGVVEGTMTFTRGISHLVTSAVGIESLMEAGFGFDIIEDRELSKIERTSRGLTGSGQVILSAVAIGSAYKPGMQTGKLYIKGKPVLATKKVTPAARARYVFDAKAGRYRDMTTGRFAAARDLPWPGNRGFITRKPGMLKPGTIIDRYGPSAGRFAGKPGSTVSQRGMAAGSESMSYARYQVMKPLSAEIGPAAPVPAFGAEGGATQYLFGHSIDELIKQGYLKLLP